MLRLLSLTILFIIAASTSGQDYPYKCSFEDDCVSHYIADKDPGKYQWAVKSSDRRFADRRDIRGKFMVAEIPNQAKKDAELTSVDMPLKGPTQCVEFYYYIYSRHRRCDGAKLTVSYKCDDMDEQIVVLTEDGKKMHNWTGVMFSVPKGPSSKCKATFKAGKATCREGTVAIDDIKIHYDKCPSSKESLTSGLECNFNNGLCNWKAGGELAWGWRLDNWETPSFRTGPSYRYRIEGSVHNTQAGKYRYVESTSNFPDKVATMESPKVKSNVPQCMRFYANMHGKDEGELSVTVITGDNEQVAWKKTGNQGVRWMEGKINMPVNKEYSVKVTAVTGNGPRSDIAVDNFVIEDGPCNGETKVKCGEDLITGSSCSIVQRDDCKLKNTTTDINGTPTTVLNYRYTQCKREFYWKIKLSQVLFPRKACLTFQYRINLEKRYKRQIFCRIDVNQYRETTDPKRPKHVHRLSRMEDNYEMAMWQTYKSSLARITLADKDTIKLSFRPNYWNCNNVDLANVVVSDGLCNFSNS